MMILARIGAITNISLAPTLLLRSLFFKSELRMNIPRRHQNRMPKREKLFNQAQKKIEYNPYQALRLLRAHTFVSFKESIQVCIRLNVNPKNGEQIVRGTANLPAGIGKTVKIAVLCNPSEYEQLKKQGIEIDQFVTDETIKKMEKGQINFEKLFTTPTHLSKLKHLGKMLGPKGLMPNAKLNTLVPLEELPRALRQAKAGQVSFRVDNGKNIHALIGKLDFSDEQILTNFHALMKALVDKRPPNMKGKYFTQAYIKSTMGPRWKLNLVDIDPRNEKSIWQLLNVSPKNQQEVNISQK